MKSSEVDADKVCSDKSDRESDCLSDSKGRKNSNKTVQDNKLMKVNVALKPPVSPTSLLAQNIALLPTGVAKVNKPTDSDKKMKPPTNPGTSTGSATGNPRNKTALAPGHSLMDWIRLGASGVDLTGVGGVTKTVTPLELSRHNKPNDAWLAIRGVVYNVTRYMDFHPGGKPELMKGVGKDATKLFDDVHAWVNYQSILQKCVVGRLNRLAVENPSTSIKTVAPSASSSTSSSASLLSRCTKQSSEGETTPPASPQPKMDWIQTSNTITFFYYALRDHPAVGYQLVQITDFKFEIKFCFEEDVISHEVELTGAVDWPPKWKRNFESMKIEFTFTKKQPGLWKTYGTFATLGEPKTKQRSYREFKVVSNTSLCKWVRLLVVRASQYLEIIPIGRHVEAKLNIMGTEVSRMYTPVPPYLHPEHVAPDYEPDCICLMVKIYPDGALTPTMTGLKSGETLTLSNSLGTFTVENYQDFNIVNMLAAGTGLTAMLPNIQWALGKRNVSRINVVNFNRDEDNVFYAKELEKICSAETRFTVTHVLSHPSDSWTGRRGETSVDLIRELLKPITHQACVFICGPVLFMRKTKEILVNLGWKSSQLHQFDD